jgi:hypothetical protein
MKRRWGGRWVGLEFQGLIYVSSGLHLIVCSQRGRVAELEKLDWKMKERVDRNGVERDGNENDIRSSSPSRP